MTRINKPIVWVAGYRKTSAYCVAVRDPWKTLSAHGWNTSESRDLGRKSCAGVLQLYCDGHHLYTDMTYYRYLFDSYHSRGVGHPGLHFMPRADFATTKFVEHKDDQYRYFWLRHDGFTGKAGNRTAKVWFATNNQRTQPWSFTIAPGSMLNLIADGEDWSLETIWFRRDVVVRPELLSLKRKLTPTQTF